MAISNEKNLVNTLKLYIFPTLVTILSFMIWRDITELKSDVKMLLAQSNIDKTEIENLKKNVELLNNQIFKSVVNTIVPTNIVLVDKYFKHEEIFDIKKHLFKS